VAPPAPPTAAPLPPPARPIGNRWGIVVAMSDYSVVRNANGFRPDQLSDLKGVRKDFANACSALQSMGFDERRVAAFLDEQCTSASIKGMLKQLAGKVQPDDLVVVFISAHGGDKQFSASRFGMPILADYRPGDPNNLDFWELQGLLKNLPGRVVWINDTCHSGGAATNMTSVEVGSRGVQVVEGVKGPEAGAAASGAPGQDFAVLTACRPSEVSWEDGERGGLFASRMFQELVARRGTTPLERIFRDFVYPAVVDRSRQICSRTKSCEQQTPVMAYQGGGGTLLL
jgi:hypothetical protein